MELSNITRKKEADMKLGLALEGGANRTIFSSGVCDGLLDLGIFPDCTVGVSAGIAYGVSYLARQRGRNLAILTNYINDDRYMGASHMINPLNNSYYNMDFIYDEIPNRLIPFDYEAFAAHTGTVEAVVTDVNTGEEVVADFDDSKPVSFKYTTFLLK